MSLPPGTRIGAYEITSQLGAAGPASARLDIDKCELWRGLAVAKVMRCK